MRQYQTIVEFLLAGAFRIHPSERGDVVCSVFAGILVELVPAEIVELRQEVAGYREIVPEITEALLDLIDGHVALREILSDAVDEPSKSADWPGRLPEW